MYVMFFMNKKIVLICLVIVLFIVVGLVVLREYQTTIIHQKNKTNQGDNVASSSAQTNQPDNVASSSNPGVLATSSPDLAYPTFAEINAIKIDKSDWQTYENKQYGFKISAPKGWAVSLTSSDKSLQNGGSLEISPKSGGDFDVPINLSVSENINNLSLKDWIIKAYLSQGASAENLNKVEIPTSEEVMSFYFQDSIYGRSYSYFIKKENLIYEFDPMSVGMGSNILHEDAMMKAIIETFRFTK
jgi:hypothetical protein